MTRHTVTRRHLGLTLVSASLLGACGSLPTRAATDAVRLAALAFDPTRYRSLSLNVNGQTVAVRAYEGLPTVVRPIEPEYQALNLYVPEAYFQGQKVGRYSAATAPIFMPNQVGGYMPAKPGTTESRMDPPTSAGAAPGAIAVALSRGLVVAAAGARGRTLRSADGTWTGKAPAAIVDLKAAVRWLRHNAGRFPGNTERIISNGTSAGGALSALLGASGNHPDHAAALQALGAADQRDDLFAVSAYCPITNLEQADAAYEWQFTGVNDYRRIEITMLDFNVQRREIPGTLTAAQIELSAALKAAFPEYVNSLGLSDPAGRILRLDAKGQGTLLDHVKALLGASAEQALAKGQDLGSRPWLTMAGGRVQAIDWGTYARTIGRLKPTPAFDGVALDTGENQLFGDARTDKRHFTAFSQARSTVSGATRADALTVRQMNAMAYLSDTGARVAPHWRIRHGAADRDTSLAIPALLAAAARARAHSVDLALPWDRPHSGDYDLPELFDWIDERVAQG